MCLYLLVWKESWREHAVSIAVGCEIKAQSGNGGGEECLENAAPLDVPVMRWVGMEVPHVKNEVEKDGAKDDAYPKQNEGDVTNS